MLDIEQEVQQVTELISLPEVYLKVRKLLDLEGSDVNDFANVISIDPNLSSQVLRVVNSAYFGLAEPVDSIPHALNMIGLDQLHNMVLSVSAISSLDLPNDILPLKPFWHGSLFAGVVARHFADRLDLERSDRLFVAGLLHEIGHLVLCAKFPVHAREVTKCSIQFGQPLHEIQQQMLDCHYGDVGAMLLANWNMSEELQALVRLQPTPLAATELQLETALLHLAHACTNAVTPVDVDSLIEPDVRAKIALSPDEINESMDFARQMSIEMAEVILK